MNDGLIDDPGGYDTTVVDSYGHIWRRDINLWRDETAIAERDYSRGTWQWDHLRVRYGPLRLVELRGRPVEDEEPPPKPKRPLVDYYLPEP